MLWNIYDRNGALLGTVEAATWEMALMIAEEVHGMRDAHSAELVKDPPGG
jgi:hypothetical protein